MKWILILTLAGPFQSSPVAISRAGEFESRELCLAAGNAWLKQMGKGYVWSRPHALCVESRR